MRYSLQDPFHLRAWDVAATTNHVILENNPIIPTDARATFCTELGRWVPAPSGRVRQRDVRRIPLEARGNAHDCDRIYLVDILPGVESFGLDDL